MVRAEAPATSANLGPGFDVLGLAWPLWNAFELEEAEQDTLSATGPFAASIPSLPQAHAAFGAVRHMEQKLGCMPRHWSLKVDACVPPARGLGSSASAVVGGLLCANAALSGGLGYPDLLELAVELEGHADNAAACLWGGVVAALPRAGGWGVLPLAHALPCGVVLVAPNYALATAAARAVLPEAWPRAEVVANLAAVTALTHALVRGSVECLVDALGDRLHQDRRATLMPGSLAVRAAGVRAGAYGVVVSGAGPTHLALAPLERLMDVEAAMTGAFAAAGHQSQSWCFDSPGPGARLLLPKLA